MQSHKKIYIPVFAGLGEVPRDPDICGTLNTNPSNMVAYYIVRFSKIFVRSGRQDKIPPCV